MTILKNSKNNAVMASNFIVSAPDAAAPAAAAAPEKKRFMRSAKRQQISITLTPELLDKLDAVADRHGLSRAAAISLAISQMVHQ